MLQEKNDICFAGILTRVCAGFIRADSAGGGVIGNYAFRHPVGLIPVMYEGAPELVFGLIVKPINNL